MVLFARRTVQRRVLAQRGSACVGYWSPASILEIAHYYHPISGEAEPDSSFLHQFCYRNSYPQTFIFSRDVNVGGPASYKASRGSRVLKLEARRAGTDPLEVLEAPAAGQLKKHAGPGTVITDVVLTQASDPGGPHHFAAETVKSACELDSGYSCPGC